MQKYDRCQFPLSVLWHGEMWQLAAHLHHCGQHNQQDYLHCNNSLNKRILGASKFLRYKLKWGIFITADNEGVKYPPVACWLLKDRLPYKYSKWSSGCPINLDVPLTYNRPGEQRERERERERERGESVMSSLLTVEHQQLAILCFDKYKWNEYEITFLL